MQPQKGGGAGKTPGVKRSKCRKELSSRQSTQLTRNSYTADGCEKVQGWREVAGKWGNAGGTVH